jgi:hypothetical protein
LALRGTSLQGLLILSSIGLGSTSARAEDWLPVSSDELQMTSVPQAPAASAIYLYRQVDRDDNGPTETIYERIKILTDEGREFANIEIPYYKNGESIRGIRARTINPDGSIVAFDGTIFDKSIVSGSGVKLMAKTFILPDIRVGSIIEYRYRHEFRSGFVYDSHWTLSDNLFTRYAKFSLNRYQAFPIKFSWPHGLPPNTSPPKEQSGRIRLETHDVPAFVSEPYMPPENELKYRVDFIYESEDYGNSMDPEVYWQRVAKKKYAAINKFLDEPRAMAQALSQIVAPGDSQEEKLRKIYERTQRLRNLTFEQAKSRQEEDREKLRDASDVSDVWNHGYGNGEEITWLFLALVRAAGIEAYPLLVSTRNTQFFNDRMMNPNDLNTNAVLAILDGKERYLDPGSQFAAMGMLPWPETAVSALRIEKKGGTWIHMPLPNPKESRVERVAALKLTAAGSLEGKLTVTYTGQEALWRRMEERHEDGTDRKQFLEDQVKADVPSGITVELINEPQWDGASSTLTAEFDLKVPGWAAAAGQRALLPVGLFGAKDKQFFQHATRTLPIYFRFPYQEVDDMSIELPPNWKIANVPQGRKQEMGVFAYERSSKAINNSLHLNRELTINAMLVATQYYGTVQKFFEVVRAGDEDQAVLVPAKSGATH